MIWLKAFHVIFMVTWFAGLFYLPRLFVYHADCQDELGLARFKIMERRLLAIMTIGALLTTVFGVAQIVLAPALLDMTWMQAKLLLVVALIGYHVWCYRLVGDFAAGHNRHSSRWYRLFNEAPSLLLIGIVLLAVLKRPL